jgi:sigma-B regulation protein RsbU (phosphoserine phosphatase)
MSVQIIENNVPLVAAIDGLSQAAVQVGKGMTTPERVVSGDLCDFLRFSNNEVGLLCADISGKGVSAALMMAHLQALVHARLLSSDESSA